MARRGRCGAAPSLRGEVEQAEPLLRGWPTSGAPAPDGSLAAEVADAPARHGAGRLRRRAHAGRRRKRWKTQINENAETAAFVSRAAEANHNEICGWERGRDAGAAVGGVPRERRPAPAHAPARGADRQLAREAGAACALVDAQGRHARSSGCCRWCCSGDLVSFYLAVLEGIDPTPVEAIERFKAELG